ncbi:MAG TPA: SdpI family protein, partial [Methanocorpusculum sp.]|nr:SdpI family protein [Methanocorpusculum sp.]
PAAGTAVLTSLLCLVPILLGLLLWDQLPDQLITHWNSAGEPDGYSPKAFGIVALPLVMCCLNLFVYCMLRIDPRIENASGTLVLLSQWFIPILTLILVPAMLFASMGADVQVHAIAPVLLGIFFIVIGRYLPETKQNYTVGIRYPWTLESEENWNRTHRLSGYLWICAGFILILTTFLSPVLTIPILAAALILVVGIPFFYSYLLYKKGV